MDLRGEVAVTITGASVGVLIFLVVALLYAFSPSFRNSVDGVIAWLYEVVYEFVGYLADAVSDAIDRAKKARKYRGYAVHHIVPKDDRRARWCRSILHGLAISVWHPFNLAIVCVSLHKHLHTNAYIAAVELCLETAKASGVGLFDKRYRVLSVLLTIKVFLETIGKTI